MDIKITEYVPTWAIEADATLADRYESVIYRYTGDADKAPDYTSASLINNGFYPCDTINKDWHPYSSGRGGKLIDAPRKLIFYFREDPPETATLEAFQGNPEHSLSLHIRSIPTLDLLHITMHSLCGETSQDEMSRPTAEENSFNKH